MLYEVLNKATELATMGRFEEEVKQANIEYFQITGPVNEDDKTFETRMATFLEWYFFDRLLESEQQTPLQYWIEHGESEFTPDEMTVLRGFVQQRHSVFEFTKIKDQVVYVVDFSDDEKLEVHERRGTSGFLKGSIFEARLLPYQDQLNFSGPILFHPHGAKKFIRKLFKDNAADDQNTILKLSAMSLKVERFRHVPLEKIYSFISSE